MKLILQIWFLFYTFWRFTNFHEAFSKFKKNDTDFAYNDIIDCKILFIF